MGLIHNFAVSAFMHLFVLTSSPKQSPDFHELRRLLTTPITCAPVSGESDPDLKRISFLSLTASHAFRRKT